MSLINRKLLDEFKRNYYASIVTPREVFLLKLEDEYFMKMINDKMINDKDTEENEDNKEDEENDDKEDN